MAVGCNDYANEDVDLADACRAVAEDAGSNCLLFAAELNKLTPHGTPDASCARGFNKSVLFLAFIFSLLPLLGLKRLRITRERYSCEPAIPTPSQNGAAY